MKATYRHIINSLCNLSVKGNGTYQINQQYPVPTFSKFYFCKSKNRSSWSRLKPYKPIISISWRINPRIRLCHLRFRLLRAKKLRRITLLDTDLPSTQLFILVCVYILMDYEFADFSLLQSLQSVCVDKPVACSMGTGPFSRSWNSFLILLLWLCPLHTTLSCFGYKHRELKHLLCDRRVGIEEGI